MGAVETAKDALFGNPPSPTMEPSREGLLAAFTELQQNISGIVSGIPAYATASLLPAVTTADNGKQARVYADSTAANNTFWIVQGGAWVIDTSYAATLTGAVQPLVDEAVEARDEANTSAAASTAASVGNERAYAAERAQPNLFSASELDFTDLSKWVASAGLTLSAVTGSTDGLTALRATVTSGALRNFYRSFAWSDIGVGPNLSAAIALIAATGTGNIRFAIQQFDSGGAEITAARQIATIATGAISAYTKQRFVAVPKASGAVTVRYYIDVDANSGARTVDFREFLMVAGSVAYYREAPGAPQASVDTINSRRAASYSPNLMADPEYAVPADGDTVAWGSGTLTYETVKANRALRTPAGGTAVALISPYRFPVGMFPSGRISASVVMRQKEAATAPADLRIRLVALNSAGNLVTATNLWNLPGNDLASGHSDRNTYYDRNVPAAAVTSPTTLTIADNLDISGVLATSGVVNIGVYIREQTTGKLWFSHLSIRDGVDPTYVPPRAVAPAAASTAAILKSSTSLPNGAQGQNPSGGFTCTGLDRIGASGKYAGCWIVGNDGRIGPDTITTGPEAVNNCSVLILSPDFTRIVKEFPISTRPSDFPSPTSIQGAVWDSSDDTIRFVEQNQKAIYHIDMDGNKLPDTIYPRATVFDGAPSSSYLPNGIAYDATNRALWIGQYTTQKAFRVSCETGAVQATLATALSADHDQLGYDEANKYLYYSRADNGVNADVVVVAADTGAAVRSWVGMEMSQAVEGVYIDWTKKRVFLVNDGGFHAAAKPPLALANMYEFGA